MGWDGHMDEEKSSTIKVIEKDKGGDYMIDVISFNWYKILGFKTFSY